MTQHLGASAARSQFDHIMERTRRHNERFIVEDGGEPAVVIISMEDFIGAMAPPPDWLKQAWVNAHEAGLDMMTMPEIDAEVDAARAEKRTRSPMA